MIATKLPLAFIIPTIMNYKCIFFSLILAFLFYSHLSAQTKNMNKKKYVLVIHGGAGTILPGRMTPDQEKEYHMALKRSLLAGYEVLKNKGSSIDAIVAAINIMEDSPLFNAGRGAVFTHDGRNEMDASIMNGADLNAGAVAGVTTIKNPINAARAVMEESEHVMLSGKGAEEFAAIAQLEIVSPDYFKTESRWEGLQKILKEDSSKTSLDHDESSAAKAKPGADEKFGTVGAVALDQSGNLAAGTSTGGMTNKKYGRIGDSPIIGAGTYANRRVGISSTGWGEFYIRSVAAYDVAALMEYKGLSLDEASRMVIQKIEDMGGDGGMIGLDAEGNVAMPFNTAGMYRGTITEDGEVEVHFYK